MVPSLNVQRDGEWVRLFDVSLDEMALLKSYGAVRLCTNGPDEEQLIRTENDRLDRAIRDIYAEKPSRIKDDMKMIVMLQIYRLRAWTEEGDILLW